MEETIKQYIQELEMWELLNLDIGVLYKDYIAWCNFKGLKHEKKQMFFDEITKIR